MRITLLPSGRTKVMVQKHDDKGVLTYFNEFKPADGKQQRAVAAAVGIPVACVVAMVGRYLDAGSQPLVEEYPDGAVAVAPPRFRRQLVAGGPVETFDSFEAAIQGGSGDHVVRWDSVDSFACLDVDFHAVELEHRPGPEWLVALGQRVSPAPSAFHVSRGRGLHLFYRAVEGLTAGHLAAAAAMWVVSEDSSVTVEIKHDTRCPVHPHHAWAQGREVGALTTLLHREATDGDAETFLRDRGMVVGQRYPHSHCPFNPSNDEKRDPVVVLDSGVFCHVCASGGHGLLRWSSLSPQASVVNRLVRSLTHWAHARLVLADRLPLPERVARLAYEALLVREHGQADPRIPRVFTAGSDMIRADGRWVGGNWQTTYQMNYARELIAEFPAVQDANGDPVRSRVDLFRQNSADLSGFGYYPVVPVRGVRIYGQHLPYPNADRVSLLTHAPRFAPDSAERLRPRYVRPAKRMPVDEAWGRLELWFPSLNRQLIELLVAAKGIAEAQVGLPPFVMINGPSGSGKSGSIHLAAGIVGDVATEFEFASGTERTRQSLLEAIDRGTYAVVNEVFKAPTLRKLGGRAAIDPILNFTPNSTSHKLFVGPVQLGRIPVLCLTDTHCPSDVYSDVQIGRRIVYARLPYRIEWERPTTAAGGQALCDLRFFDPGMPDACNAILSDVIDRFFVEPRVFVDIARDLGFDTLERTTEFADDRARLREFFDAVVAAPPISATEAARLPGPGWKKVSRNGESDIDSLWLELCDGEGDGFARSRACEEADWSQVLGLSRRRLDFKCSKKSSGILFVRFIEPGTSPVRVNEEITLADGVRP